MTALLRAAIASVTKTKPQHSFETAGVFFHLGCGEASDPAGRQADGSVGGSGRANPRLPITQQIVRKLAVEIASNVSYPLMLSFIGQRRNEPARSGGSSR